MATTILFTTVEAIRSCLGLEASDAPDELILNMNLRTQLMLDLDSWYTGSYSDDFANSGVDPLDPQDDDVIEMTAAERKGHLLSAYSMWFGAHRLIETLLVMPQKVSDGKDELQRFNGINLEKMLDRVKGNGEALKNIMIAEQENRTVRVLGAVRSESETYDVVTGS